MRTKKLILLICSYFALNYFVENMIIVKKIISVYDEINRSIVKRKRKYDRGEWHEENIKNICLLHWNYDISIYCIGNLNLKYYRNLKIMKK